MNVKGKYIVLINGNLKEYSNYNDIPMSFDNLIKCDFEYPEGPHTEEEHELIGKFNGLLQDLMKREKK